MPLGPDQAVVRLGVRRCDFDQMVRLGWLAPVGSVALRGLAGTGGPFRQAVGTAHSAGSARSLVV